MLDGIVRKNIDPVLNAAGRAIAGTGITPNTITLSGWIIGIAAAIAIAFENNITGLVLILASRAADGLDGAVAKVSGTSDFGGYLDIVLDFFFYGAIPLGFVLADPGNNAIAGAILIFSFYFNGSTFLAYSALAEKNDIKTNVRGSKALYFTTGLAEATETIVVFMLFCLFPGWFSEIAYVFALICFWTSLSRIFLARQAFP